MRYCAYQDRCHQEVQQKLQLLEVPYDLRDELIVDLIRQDFLNEERFAKSYVRGKFRIKSWGRYKIRQSLKQKGLHERLIERTIASEIENTEYDNTLRQLAVRQWEKLENKTPGRKAQVQKYLHNKGYESELIRQVLEEISK